MATSKYFSNVKDCAHGAVSINEVQSIEMPDEHNVIFARGDDDIYPTHISISTQDPIEIVVTTDDLEVANAIANGTKANLVWKTVGKGSGSEITYTANKAMLKQAPQTFTHGEKSVATMVFVPASTDGATHPISEA